MQKAVYFVPNRGISAEQMSIGIRLLPSLAMAEFSLQKAKADGNRPEIREAQANFWHIKQAIKFIAGGEEQRKDALLWFCSQGDPKNYSSLERFARLLKQAGISPLEAIERYANDWILDEASDKLHNFFTELLQKESDREPKASAIAFFKEKPLESIHLDRLLELGEKARQSKDMKTIGDFLFHAGSFMADQPHLPVSDLPKLTRLVCELGRVKYISSQKIRN